MERLNEIISRTAQRRQGGRESGLDKSSPYSTLTHGQRAGTTPGHRPLPEQNARLGQYGNSPRAQQQPGATNRTVTPPRSQHSTAPARPQGNAGGAAHYLSGQRSAGGRYTPPPERNSWPQANHAPAHRAETYRAASQGDARADWSGEWEEDTGSIPSIQYGDWESDGYNEVAPARDASESYVLNRAAARIAQTYPRSQRSLVTRELRSQMDEEVEPSVTPHAREVRSPIALPPAQVAQHAGQTPRLTQPLNRSAAMTRLNQDTPGSSQPVIPAPYTTSNAMCPVCKGAGYLRADVPYGHPNFGKPIACECKEVERTARRRRQLQELSNLGELHDKSFENFNLNTSRSVYNAYHIALEYAEDPYGWLVLIGKVGCGKTHLAAAIANRLLARGSLVLFSTVSDLLDHLRATFVPTSTEVYDQLFQKMREAALLVLDDLGAQQSSPWANEKLFQLLNYRYNSRIPTIITTNNTGLQGVEERIRSRMSDTSLVTRVTFEDAIDYRLRNPRRD